MAIDVRRYDSQDALYAAFRDVAHAAWGTQQEPHQGLVLPGGSTPGPLYARLAEASFPAATSAWAIMSDERHVLPGDPASNYEAMRPMFDALGFRADQVLRVPYSLGLEDAADAYAGALQRFLDSGGAIPVAFVGLGGDGHTCSLFDEAGLEAAAGKLAIPVTRPEPPHRVSITPTVLERAGKVVFLVAGEAKNAVVEQLVADPSSVIAGRATANCPTIEVWHRL